MSFGMTFDQGLPPVAACRCFGVPPLRASIAAVLTPLESDEDLVLRAPVGPSSRAKDHPRGPPARASEPSWRRTRRGMDSERGRCRRAAAAAAAGWMRTRSPANIRSLGGAPARGSFFVHVVCVCVACVRAWAGEPPPLFWVGSD